MERYKHIALIGKTRSGKDEVARLLTELSYPHERVAFGDIMKEKFYDIFPQYTGKPKPTKEIIMFGQSMRAINEDVWVNYLMGNIRAIQLFHDTYQIDRPVYVFTDVRQQNEYDACKELGCIMVKVNSGDALRVGRMLAIGEQPSKEVLQAKTETDLDKFEADEVINNNGTLEDLAHEVERLMIKLEG